METRNRKPRLVCQTLRKIRIHQLFPNTCNPVAVNIKSVLSLLLSLACAFPPISLCLSVSAAFLVPALRVVGSPLHEPDRYPPPPNRQPSPCRDHTDRGAADAETLPCRSPYSSSGLMSAAKSMVAGPPLLMSGELLMVLVAMPP